MKYLFIWLAACSLVSSLPQRRMIHDEDLSESDLMKIVSKLTQNIKDHRRPSKDNPKEQYIDVTSDSSNDDSSYIIEDENKKRYRVKIKKKIKTTSNESNNKDYKKSNRYHESNESANVDDNNAVEDTPGDLLSVHRRITEGASENRDAYGDSEKDKSSEPSDETKDNRHRAGKTQVIKITKHRTTYSNKRIHSNENEGPSDVPDVIQNICQTLNIKPADVWLLANTYFGLDIHKNRDLNKLKNIYNEFITHVRENPGNDSNISAFKAWLEVNSKDWSKNNQQFTTEETSFESIYKPLSLNKLKNKYQHYILNLKNPENEDQVLSYDDWLESIYSNQKNPEFSNEVSSENMHTLENIKKLKNTIIKTTNEESVIDENDPVEMSKVSQGPNNGGVINNNSPKFSVVVSYENENKPNILKKIKEDYSEKSESNKNQNKINVTFKNGHITEETTKSNKVTHQPRALIKEETTHGELKVDNNDPAKGSEILLDDGSLEPNDVIKNNNPDILVHVSSENVNKLNLKKNNEYIEPQEKGSEILLDDGSLEPTNAIKNNNPDISVEMPSDNVNKPNLKKNYEHIESQEKDSEILVADGSLEPYNAMKNNNPDISVEVLSENVNKPNLEKNNDEHIEPEEKNNTEVNSQIATSTEDEIKLTLENVKDHDFGPHMKEYQESNNNNLLHTVKEWVESPKNTIENKPQLALEMTPELYEYVININDLNEKVLKHEIQPNEIHTDENSVPDNIDKGKITNQNIIIAIAKDNSQDDEWLDTNKRKEPQLANEVTSEKISLEDIKENKNPKIENKIPSIKEWFKINTEYFNESSPEFENKVKSQVNSEASEELKKLQPTYDQKANIGAEQKNIKNLANKEHEKVSPKTYFISTFESPDERYIESFSDKINVKSPRQKIQPDVIPNKSPHISSLEEIYEKLANTNEMKNGTEKATVVPMLHEDTTRRHFGKTTHPSKLNQSHKEINEVTLKRMSIPKEIDENEFVNTFGIDVDAKIEPKQTLPSLQKDKENYKTSVLPVHEKQFVNLPKKGFGLTKTIPISQVTHTNNDDNENIPFPKQKKVNYLLNQNLPKMIKKNRLSHPGKSRRHFLLKLIKMYPELRDIIKDKVYQVLKENKHPESWDLDMFDDPTSEQKTPDNFDPVKTSQITPELQIPRPNRVLLPLRKPVPKIKKTTLEEFIQSFEPNAKQPSIKQDTSADKSIENTFFIDEDDPNDADILKHTFTVPEIRKKVIPGLQLDDDKSKKNKYFLLIPKSVLTDGDFKRTPWYKFIMRSDGFLDSDGQFVNSKLYNDEPSPKQNYYYGLERSLLPIKASILRQEFLLSPRLQSMGSDLIPPKSFLDVPKPDIVHHLQNMAKDILRVTSERIVLYLSVAGVPTENIKSIIMRINTEMFQEFRIGATKCPSNDLNIFIEMLKLKIKQYVTGPSREQ